MRFLVILLLVPSLYLVRLHLVDVVILHHNNTPAFLIDALRLTAHLFPMWSLELGQHLVVNNSNLPSSPLPPPLIDLLIELTTKLENQILFGADQAITTSIASSLLHHNNNVAASLTYLEHITSAQVNRFHVLDRTPKLIHDLLSLVDSQQQNLSTNLAFHVLSNLAGAVENINKLREYPNLVTMAVMHANTSPEAMQLLYHISRSQTSLMVLANEPGFLDLLVRLPDDGYQQVPLQLLRNLLVDQAVRLRVLTVWPSLLDDIVMLLSSSSNDDMARRRKTYAMEILVNLSHSRQHHAMIFPKIKTVITHHLLDRVEDVTKPGLAVLLNIAPSFPLEMYNLPNLVDLVLDLSQLEWTSTPDIPERAVALLSILSQFPTVQLEMIKDERIVQLAITKATSDHDENDKIKNHAVDVLFNLSKRDWLLVRNSVLVPAMEIWASSPGVLGARGRMMQANLRQVIISKSVNYKNVEDMISFALDVAPTCESCAAFVLNSINEVDQLALDAPLKKRLCGRPNSDSNNLVRKVC
jgi:hypothetical protein